MLLTVLLICTSCSASAKGDTKIFFESQKEFGYGKVMKDSISSIMLNTKKISCELLSKNPIDTIRLDTIKVVPAKMQPTVQFLFFNVDNFQSNDTVYAKFIPWARYKFAAKKNQAVYVEFDFSLKKWRLLDASKKQICASDMKENSMQFLYFTILLFPNDPTLNLLSENLKAAKK